MDYAKWANQEIARMAEPKGRTELKTALAERVGIALSTLHARLRGEGKFNSTEVGKMAEFFGVESPARKRTNGAHPASSNVIPLQRPMRIAGREVVLYPVLGAVEAGSFREADLLAQVEPYDIPGPQNPNYPNATPMAWIAHGDSMNNEKIFDGSILFGVDFQQTGGVPKNGDIVVVEQNRGGLIERSVKAVAIFPDRTEFQPRSTNPIHKAIVYKNGNHDEDVTVRILTVVHGMYNSTGN
jgi:SOS-response transcriptional repressor LexA